MIIIKIYSIFQPSSAKRFSPLTKVRVDTKEMMNFVNGKKMEESDLCSLLQDMGVILDRTTWTTMKDAYKASQLKPKPSFAESELVKSLRFKLYPLHLDGPFKDGQPGMLQGDVVERPQEGGQDIVPAETGRFSKYYHQTGQKTEIYGYF